jgi:hypothetical protein
MFKEILPLLPKMQWKLPGYGGFAATRCRLAFASPEAFYRVSCLPCFSLLLNNFFKLLPVV